MPVHIINKQRAVKLSVENLRRLLEGVLEEELGRDARVNVLLTNDRQITELNRRFRGEEGPTDVLSWGLEEESGEDDEPVLGDVAASGETAVREAPAHGTSPEEELTRYAVHGVLHLAGYDDETVPERRRMWRRQEQVMKGVSKRDAARGKEERGR